MSGISSCIFLLFLILGVGLFDVEILLLINDSKIVANYSASYCNVK